MAQLHLQLTLEETNQVLAALGEQPYSRVYLLIQKIREQAAPQLEAQEQTPGADTPPSTQLPS